MRWLRWTLTVGAAVVMIIGIPATASAAGYTGTVSGVEYSYSATMGKFAGAASGDLPGVWRATVVHTPLSPHATITSGDLRLEMTGSGESSAVRAAFRDGTVR